VRAHGADDPGQNRPHSKGQDLIAGRADAHGVGGQFIRANRDERSPDSFTEDGWLKTGDVAVIDVHGYIRLVDRTKDVIKSGGEWISSVDLENELMGHPKVAEAAVIGVPHPKWSERPLACVVVRPGEELTKEEVLGYLEDKVAKWWLPDDVVFVDEIPKTSVGKFSKKDLRDKFEGYALPT
jgi:fatty-acyl-CoA synthase